MAVITGLDAWEVLDSRGWPTLAVEVTVDQVHRGLAMVPSGASTGSHEALELRDGDPARYLGRGVLRAAGHVRGELAAALLGRDPCDQAGLDAELVALDGTRNRSRLGANALLGVSLATARAAAACRGVPLYRYLGGAEARELPLPMINLISGGRHAGNNLNLQDFLVIPAGASSYSMAVEQAAAVRAALYRRLPKEGRSVPGVADEGGFGPELANHEQALTLVSKAAEDVGLQPGRDTFIGLDVAASEFYDATTQRYRLTLEERSLTAAELVDVLADWCDRYPILSIEDGLAEDDVEGWCLLTRRLGERLQLIGDDLFVTQAQRLQHGLAQGLANAVLIKPNQVGTLSETLTVMELARRARYHTVVSARSGETEDPFIADLAVATVAGQIKIGSLARSERLAKYNRLLEIERELGERAVYRGAATFSTFLQR